MILITGGAGFIGGNFVHHWFERRAKLGLPVEPVVVFDKLTYAGNPATIQTQLDAGQAHLVHADIADRDAVRKALAQYQPRAVLHFAAESHVDRSIHGPGEFIHTNMVGTFSLLEEVRAYWNGPDSTLSPEAKASLRFLHVSTDEVYGSLSDTDPAFSETTPLRPQQPLLRQQGRQRPPGPGLPPHVRVAHTHHQLQQQLRALPLPGKADPADDPQRTGWQALARLW